MLHKVRFFYILAAIFCFTACGQQETEDDTPRLVPTITAQEKLPGVSRAGTLLIDGVLYYSDAYSGEEKTETTVYRKEEGREAETLASFPLSEQLLFHYFADREGAVYYLYCQAEAEGEEAGFRVYLRKEDAEKKELYCTLLNEETVPAPKEGESVWAAFPEGMGKWYGVKAGAADSEGRVYLYSSRKDSLYLLDQGGNLAGELACAPVEAGQTDADHMDSFGAAGMARTGVDEEGLICAGGECYFYSLGQTKAAIRRIDLEAGALSPWEELPFQPDDIVFLSGCDGNFDDSQSGGGDDGVSGDSQAVGSDDGVFGDSQAVGGDDGGAGASQGNSGAAAGILVNTNQALYLYRPSSGAGNGQSAGADGFPSGEVRELVSWADVLLSGNNILQACVDGTGCRALSTKNSSIRFLRIENREAADATGKQTITLGVRKGYDDSLFQQLATYFNEDSLLYQVELVWYDFEALVNQTLYLELLRGEGPDLLDLNSLSLPMSDLAAKGVLEDLTPYLEQSETVSREDILPRVIEAGSYGEKLVNLIPLFSIDTLVVRQGYTENGGWTPEEFFAYCEEYPEVSLYQSAASPVGLLSALIGADSSAYIDWEKKECYFDTESFVRLLESVGNVNLSGSGVKEGSAILYSGWGLNFRSGSFLAGEYSLETADKYVHAMNSLEEYGEFASYPTGSGEPHYILSPMMSFGINSSSQCREGAWEFLEYLLAIDFGDWEGTSISYFSANRERFEASLVSNPMSDIVIDDKHSLHWRNYFTGEKMDNVPYPRLTEEAREALLFMADNMYCNDMSRSIAEYQIIIREEAQAYFAGDKSAEEVAGLIQNRVRLYLQE